MRRPGYRTVVMVSCALLFLPLSYSILSRANQPPPTPFLAPAIASSDCVLPPRIMREQHMIHLKVLRDEVVRVGGKRARKRAAAEGMGSCPRCHAERQAFCNRCHEKAGVSLDCFGCHGY